MKIGVDLSMWNSPSNFIKAKANGLDFAILRAGSGRTVKDLPLNEIIMAVLVQGYQREHTGIFMLEMLKAQVLKHKSF